MPSRPRRRRGKYTPEEQKIATQWRNYALLVAFRRAYHPIRDADAIETIAHDAVLTAARYYRPGRGAKSICSFIVKCVVQKLNRYYYPTKHRFLTIPIQDVDENALATCDDKTSPRIEASEVIDKLVPSMGRKDFRLMHDYYWIDKSYLEMGRARRVSRETARKECLACIENLRTHALNLK